MNTYKILLFLIYLLRRIPFNKADNRNILKGKCIFVLDYSKVIDFHLMKE